MTDRYGGERRAQLLGLCAALTGCGTGGAAVPQYTDDVDSLRAMGGMGGMGPVEPPPDEPRPLPESPRLPEVPPPIDVCPQDNCPVDGGVSFRCRSRFVYGVNWAWNRFGTDFGGLARGESKGISGDPLRYSAVMSDMKAHGVNVIRWWMFPDFRGDAVVFDENGVPSGLGESVLEDISAALELAQIHDVYLMLVLFSFDGFKPSFFEGPFMTPIVLDPTLREALVENVVRPVAAHVEASEHKIRLHSWDLINEPEWAMIGDSLYGDADYLESDTGTEPISHGEMEQFLAEVNTVLRQESSAQISVGTTLKWPHSWSGLDLDFHQLHYYPWLEPHYPLDVTPTDLGLGDKPVVLGEFPLADEYADGSKYTYAELLDLLWENGWAGALGWDWNQATTANKQSVRTFAENYPCETAY